ncbi:hypothetical protein CEXT_447301 [Caerostris extrusa]|uniref:Uncharacterized protein n=1 Tax=Caerostris extrusa TaxID=172846 RepID=A0AAV4P5Q3_CAEEX|nr:hypothetical protein CEXT_447301 [Caerostris extrusa]
MPRFLACKSKSEPSFMLACVWWNDGELLKNRRKLFIPKNVQVFPEFLAAPEDRATTPLISNNRGTRTIQMTTDREQNVSGASVFSHDKVFCATGAYRRWTMRHQQGAVATN